MAENGLDTPAGRMLVRFLAGLVLIAGVSVIVLFIVYVWTLIGDMV